MRLARPFLKHLVLFSFLLTGSYLPTQNAQAGSLDTLYGEIKQTLETLNQKCADEKDVLLNEENGCPTLRAALQVLYSDYLKEIRKTELVVAEQGPHPGEPCLSNPDSVLDPKNEATLAHSINVSQARVQHDELKSIGLNRFLFHHPDPPDEAAWLDKRIKLFIKEHQDYLIKKLCPGQNTESFRELLTAEDQPLGGRELLVDSKKCLKSIGRINWESPELAMALLSKDPALRAVFARKFAFPQKVNMLASISKNLRAQLAADYFQTRFFDHAAQSTKTPASELQKKLTIIGFNRLFSPRNSMGAAPTSDVDFNVIFNDSKVDPTEVAEFKKKTTQALILAKGEFEDLLRMKLEVADFTVYPISDFNEALQKRDEAKLYFYSTIRKNFVHLAGDVDLSRQVSEKLEGTLNKREAQKMTFEQYMGPRTRKGSINAIVQMPQLRRNSTGDANSKRLLNTFAGPYIGKEEADPQNWLFSLKYQAMRIYDGNPTDPSARSLNEIGNAFQFLLDLYHQKHPPITEQMETTLTSKQFVELSKAHKTEVTELISQSCQGVLRTKPQCGIFLKKVGKKNVTDEELSSAGFSFFKSLHDIAIWMTYEYAHKVKVNPLLDDQSTILE